MRNRELSDEEQKTLLLLKSTYEMHLKTKEEALLRGKTENVGKIDQILSNTVNEMSKIDPEFARKCVADNSTATEKLDITSIIGSNEGDKSIFEVIGNDEKPKIEIDESIVNDTDSFYEQFTGGEPDLYKMADSIDNEKQVNDSFKQSPQDVSVTTLENADEKIYNDTDPNAQYDLIPLPSKGECYGSKLDRVPVGYLTAADENLITSPNLYESGSITSILLKKKIMNKNINVDNLISGDVDAIMVFLRGTSYGNDFPIVATDPKSGKRIETTVDLSKLKYKPFTLKGDDNGHFDFTLPRTKRKVKFRFLTKKDERLLQKINKKESQGVAVFDVREAIDKIKSALKADDKMNDSDRNVIIDASDKLEKWSKDLSGRVDGATPYTKSITNTMEMQIVSVDGNTDRKYIHEFVMNMPASDSLAFRRYVYDNQPGVDFEVDVERPVSLGGGTFKCFLEWDDYVFWHIS